MNHPPRSMSNIDPSTATNDAPASALFSAQKFPAASHLGGAHKLGATYSSHRAPSTYSLGNGRVLARLGWAGEIVTLSVFRGPAGSPSRRRAQTRRSLLVASRTLRPCICRRLLRLITKGNVGQAPHDNLSRSYETGRGRAVPAVASMPRLLIARAGSGSVS